MMGSRELIEALDGLHAAQGHTIEAISDVLKAQAEEIQRLRKENASLSVDEAYWRYQLECRGITIADKSRADDKPGVRG